MCGHVDKWHVSSNFNFFQETISTCRFAQRVALVKNEAILNEELDPKLVCVCFCSCLFVCARDL